MRVTSKGQVTIPQALREKLGILPDTEVDFELSGKTIILRKAKSSNSRGQRIVNHLRGTGSGTRMTTDEIMALTRGE